MSNPLALELKINALVEGMANLSKLASELRETGTAATSASNESVAAANKTDNAYKTLGIRAFSEIRAEINKVSAAYRDLADSGQLSANEQTVALQRAKFKIAELNQEMSGVAPATEKAGASMRGLSGAVVSTVAALVSLSAALSAIKQASQAAMELDRIKTTLSTVAGGSQGAAKELAFLRAESERLGLDLRVVSKDFADLAASTNGTSLAGKQTREIFSSIAEASTVLGLSADQTSGALNAVTQMISKGTVSAEELRGQLGERIPGAFQMAARAMGLSTAELNKMLEQGELMTSDFLPKFAAEMKKTFANGLPEATSGARAEFTRLKNSIFETAAAIGQSGLNQGLAEAAKILREKLADPAVQEGLKSLGQTIGQVAVFLAKFGAELATIAAVLGGTSLFKRMNADLIETQAKAAAAGASLGLMQTSLRGVGTALTAMAPWLTAFTILYQGAQMATNAIVEYAEKTRNLTEAEKKRAVELKENIEIIKQIIKAHEQSAVVQIKSAKEILALSPQQLAVYQAELEAKKDLELAELRLATNKQELLKYQLQEAIAADKSASVISSYKVSLTAANEEVLRASKAIKETNDGLNDLKEHSTSAKEALDNGITPAAGKLVAQFKSVEDKTKDVDAALKKLFEGFDPRKFEGVKAVMEALDVLGKKGLASGEQIKNALEKSINSLDYRGLINLQTNLDAVGAKGTVAAGLVVQALGRVSDAAKAAADDFIRMTKQMTEMAVAEVNLAKAHLDIVKADIDVRRAKLDVRSAENKLAKEGTDLAKKELDLARTNLEISKAKALEAKLQYEQTFRAKEVLLNQQRQINAEIDIELHRGEEIYVQKARQAQQNTEDAKLALELASQHAAKQQEVVFKLEEQKLNQEFLVEESRLAAEETKKIKENMDGATAATVDAARAMGDLSAASKRVSNPIQSSGSSSSAKYGITDEDKVSSYHSVDSLSQLYQDAGLDGYNALMQAQSDVLKQPYLDVTREIQKIKDSKSSKSEGYSSGGFPDAFKIFGNSQNLNLEKPTQSGIVKASSDVLNRLPSSSQSFDSIKKSMSSNVDKAAAPSKVIQVDFTDGKGKTIPMSVEASNEAALISLLQRAKGVSV